MKILNESILKEAQNVASRLNFKQGGFERDKSIDFRDDGIGYRHHSGMPMTYSKSRDLVFISLRPDYFNELDYFEYKELPSYGDADIYDGVQVSEVNMKKLNEIATNLMKEYKEKVEEVTGADYEEGWKKYVEDASTYYKNLYIKVRGLVMENFDKLLDLSEYSIKDVFTYLQRLKEAALTDYEKIGSTPRLKRRYSVDGFKPEFTFYYDEIEKLFK